MRSVTPDELATAVGEELDAFAGHCQEAIINAQKAAAKVARKELRKGPGKNYPKEWTTKTETTRTGATTYVYQGKRPGLAHLLEFGHPIVSGGRTVGQARAFPHIKPAEEAAMEKYEEEIQKGIENGA
jgi:hypothetical protein